MNAKEITILATSIAILGALGVALATGRIEIEQFLTAVTLLVLPSAPGMLMSKKADQ